MVDLASDATYYWSDIYAISDTAHLVRVTRAATNESGGDILSEQISLFDGLRSTLEIFDLEQLDEARRRFEELAHVAPTLENAATRMGRRLHELLEADDFDGIASLLSDDMTFRHASRAGLFPSGKQGYLDWVGARHAAWGEVSRTGESIAIRGDRLSLDRGSIRRAGDDGYQTEFLGLRELDEDGRIKATIDFDADDLDAAYAELNRRYMAGEGGEFADVFRTVLRRERPTDAVFVDHRTTLVPPAESIEDHARRVAIVRDFTSSFDFRAINVLALDAHGAVLHMRDEGTTDDGSVYEWQHLTVVEVRNGSCARMELFDLDARDATLARFEELKHAIPPLANSATRMGWRLHELLETDDFDGIASLLSDDMTFRSASHKGRLPPGKQGYLDWGRGRLAAWGDISRSTETIAIRGDCLSLFRLIIQRTDDDGYRNEFLGLRELDEDGRIKAAIFFDPDDLDAAFEELDRRYEDGEGAPIADRLRAVRTDSLALSERVGTFAGRYGDDVVVHDHRPGGFGMLHGLHAWQEAVAAMADLAPDAKFYRTQIYAVTERLSLYRLMRVATNPSGGEVVNEQINLMQFRDGRICRIESFALEQLDDARRRFDELDRPVPSFENAATRASRRLMQLIDEERWDDAAACLSEDAIAESRVGKTLFLRSGRDEYIAYLKPNRDLQGRIDRDVTVVAIRGKRLSLQRVIRRPAEPDKPAFVHDNLGVFDLDEQGLIQAIVTFDPDDVDAAFEELDQRYMAGEGAPYADVFDVVRTLSLSQSSRAFADDMAVIDHRPGSFMDLRSKDEFLEAYDLDRRPQTMWLVAVHAIDEHSAVVQRTATDADERGYEWNHIFVRWVRNGVIVRSDVFNEDQLDEALGFFASHREPRRLENACTRQLDQSNVLVRTGDDEAFAAIIRSDFVIERRRPDNALLPERGNRASFVREATSSLRSGVATWAFPVLATRGDRLALFARKDRVSGDIDSFTYETLVLREVDGDGLLKAVVQFDGDDLDGAYAELDGRYLAGEAASLAGVWDVVRVRSPYQAPNAYADDMVVIDHQPGSGLDVSSKDEFREIHDIGHREGTHRIVAVHAMDARGAVLQRVQRQAEEDGPLEWERIFVRWVRGGVIFRSDIFTVDQLDEALAFFATHSEPARLVNACTRHRDLWGRAIIDRDFDRLITLATPDFVTERRIKNDLAPAVMDIHRWIDWVRTQDDVGYSAFEGQPSTIAIRGDTLGLFKVGGKTDTEPGAFEFSVLVVREVTSEGLAKRAVYFAPDDLDGAVEELDRLYVTGEAAPYAEVYRVARSRLLDRPEAFASDVVVTDRSRASLLNYRSRDEALAQMGALIGELKDPQLYFSAVHALDERGAVFQSVLKEGADDAIAIEYGHIFVRFVENGRIVQQDRFGDDQLDEALEFFRTHRTRAPLQNAATRHHVVVGNAIMDRDLDRLAGLFAPDFVAERRVARDVIPERMDSSGFVEWVRSGAYADFPNFGGGTLAIRGDTLGLFRAEVKTDDEPGAFTYSALLVREVTPEGLGKAAVYLGEDHLADAHTELGRRYLAGEGAEHADVLGPLTEHGQALNARDSDAYRSLLADDFVSRDHRPALLAHSDREGSIQASQELFRLVPDVFVAVARYHAIGRNAVCAEAMASGTDAEGSLAEWPFLAVMTVREGKIRTRDLFEPDDLDEALALFHQLEASSASS